MKKFYYNLLSSLRKKGEVLSIQKVVYKGGIPSLNDLYGTKHWTSRYKDAVKYHTVFKALLYSKLGKPKKQTEKFSIYIFYNSRHDTDNIVGIEKYFTDMLVKENYVPGDSKAYFRSLVIVPDEELDKNTVEFVFITHSYVNN